MSDIEVTDFKSGTIRFEKKIEAVPATTKTEGNVTINHTGSDEIPAHYVVDFTITAVETVNEIASYNYWSWSTVVLCDDEDASYRDIESQAARKAAPALRAVADQIETLVAEFDNKRDKKSRAQN